VYTYMSCLCYFGLCFVTWFVICGTLVSVFFTFVLFVYLLIYFVVLCFITFAFIHVSAALVANKDI